MRRVAILLPFVMALAACATGSGQNGDFLAEVPQEVVDRAAPNQNLRAVTILEEDGCFWYQYVGPVETTLLPLMSRSGRHLCTAREETEAAA